MKDFNTKLTLKMITLFKKNSIKIYKMFSLDNNFIKRISPALSKIVILLNGKKTGLTARIRIAKNFFNFLLKMKAHHGIIYTVKWLKACAVCLQKYLGDDTISTLRVLEPNLPLPRVINGLPAFINKRDRQLIREGNTKIIRFWLSLFSVYRIISMPGEIKIKTITDPFSGDDLKFKSLLENSQLFNYFSSLPKFITWSQNLKLAPRSFILSRKSSPTVSHSFMGILTDVYVLRDSMLEFYIAKYLTVLKQYKYNTTPFFKRWTDAVSLVESIDSKYGLNFNFKKSYTGYLGQLSTKVEAAGKIRVFALVDSVTQSIFKPLHDSLFDLLRLIPNDGTFDQDASVERSIKKSIDSGCAFSYDLSAATDRLPALLSSKILSKILGIPEIGDLWLKILTEREFSFNEKTISDYNLKSATVKYAVGQPMGALSSWAMLALTHHWILQYCWSTLGNRGWCTEYEILGDDLVIFNPILADQYLKVCIILGVEINLNKSISSPNKATFEFAKRTIVNGVNVSAISFREITASVSLSSRVQSALVWWRAGLVKTSASLLALISVNPFKVSKKPFMGVLSLLGGLNRLGLVPARKVFECLINPHDEDFDIEESPLSLPVQSILSTVVKNNENSLVLSLPTPDPREEYSDEWEPLLVATILQIALSKAKVLQEEWDNYMSSTAHQLLTFSSCHINEDKKEYSCPETCLLDNKVCFDGCDLCFKFSDISREEVIKENSLLIAQLIGWFEDNLIDYNKGWDPSELTDEIESKLSYHAKTSKVTWDEALTILDHIEAKLFAVCFQLRDEKNVSFKDIAPFMTLVGKATGLISVKYWREVNV